MKILMLLAVLVIVIIFYLGWMGGHIEFGLDFRWDK